MTHNYDRPHYGPDGKYRYHRIFIEEHNSLQDDQYLQCEAREARMPGATVRVQDWWTMLKVRFFQLFS